MVNFLIAGLAGVAEGLEKTVSERNSIKAKRDDYILKSGLEKQKEIEKQKLRDQQAQEKRAKLQGVVDGALADYDDGLIPFSQLEQTATAAAVDMDDVFKRRKNRFDNDAKYKVNRIAQEAGLIEAEFGEAAAKAFIAKQNGTAVTSALSEDKLLAKQEEKKANPEKAQRDTQKRFDNFDDIYALGEEIKTFKQEDLDFIDETVSAGIDYTLPFPALAKTLKSLTGITDERVKRLQEVRTKLQMWSSINIPTTTGEEGTRKAEAEQKRSAETLAVAATAKNIGKIHASVDSILQIVSDRARREQEVANSRGYDVVIPDRFRQLEQAQAEQDFNNGMTQPTPDTPKIIKGTLPPAEAFKKGQTMTDMRTGRVVIRKEDPTTGLPIWTELKQ